MADVQISLPPEAEAFVNRVRKVEGTLGGKGYLRYGEHEEFTPTKDFPQWEGIDVGGKKTHAAGPGQWQPGTWEEQKEKFKGYGLDLDFSNETHQKAAIWDKGHDEYKKATGRDLGEDLKANKVEWSKLAPTWQGFEPRVTHTDKPGGSIDQKAVAYEQSRPHQSVWYVDPMEMLALLPEIPQEEARPKRRSLRKSLFEQGEDIYNLPEIELSADGDRRKIKDFDGRNRLKAMAEAGLTAVPVVLKGVEPGVRPIALEGMTGKIMPMKFDPVPIVSRETTQDTLRTDPYGSAKDVLGRVVRSVSGAALGGKPVDPSSPDAASLNRQTQQPDDGAYAGSIIPLTQGPEGSGPPRPAVPEMIASPVRGMESMGERAMGATPPGGPLAPLESEQINALAALAGSRAAGRVAGGMRTQSPPPATPAASGWPGGALPSWAAPAPSGSSLRLLAPEPPLAPLARNVFSETRVGTPEAQQAFNRAAIREMGENAPHATQDVMEAARLRIGSGLERIESNHAVTFDPEFRGDMIGIQRDAEKALTTKGQLRVVNGLLKDVMVDPVKTEAAKKAALATKTAPGVTKTPPKDVVRSRLSGEQFGNLMHQNGPVAKIVGHSDPAVANFGKEIRGALRDLLERRLPPDVAAEYRNLRYQWGAMKTIEPTVEKSPTGDIDPKLLNTQVSQSYRRRNAKGRAYQPSPLDQLAKAGVQYMREPGPQHKVAEFVAHMLGGALGHMTLGGMHGYFAGGVAGKLAMERLLRVPRVAPPPPRLLPPPPAPNSLQAIVGANPGPYGRAP